jgi:hypothetical protein
MLLLLACTGLLDVRQARAPEATEGGGGSGDTAADADTDADTDADIDTEPLILDYPDHRVGMFYLTWHAYAYDAVARLPSSAQLTVEDVIRGGDLQFSDLISDAGLYDAAFAFHWHQEPAIGFYSLYRPRDGEPTPAEPYGAEGYPDTASIAAAHASQLWNAGVDFVYVDLTNLQTNGDFADVLGVRPLEVLLEEWGALRRAGVPTPQVAAWLPLTDVGAAEPIFRAVLDAYDTATPDLILTHDGREVLFVVENASLPISAANRAEVEARGVLPVPMWGNLSEAELNAGRAGWMQPCTTGANFTPFVDPTTPCDQWYTTASPLGTVVSVSRSYQMGYASLPLQASGRRDGLTFQRQMATALAVQPDYLLVNAWNEHIAQPQANPYDASYGALRRSMGVTDAADGSADWLWVDMYGAEFNRDFEPTLEDGGAGYALLQSCLRVYQTGATSCTDGSEACCQLADPLVLVRSVRWAGGTLAGDHVPTLDASEADALAATGYWEEVCNPHYGPPGLCGGGTTGDGPFQLYTTAGSDRVALYRCYSGADHFISGDSACEGRTTERLLGYGSAVPTSAMPRPLTRCYVTDGPHLHWLDGACPAGSNGEAVLAYVR